jgi:hypothetical protein
VALEAIGICAVPDVEFIDGKLGWPSLMMLSPTGSMCSI